MSLASERVTVKCLRAEVRRTVETEAEVDEELHELLRVLTRG